MYKLYNMGFSPLRPCTGSIAGVVATGSVLNKLGQTRTFCHPQLWVEKHH